MTRAYDIMTPVYRVGDRDLSMRDLLDRFRDAPSNGDVLRLSDLHLKTGQPACYRFDDEIRPLEGATPLTEEVVWALLGTLLRPEQLEELRARDVDASADLEDTGLGFRVNAFRDRDGPACAIRVLTKTVPAPERIGFPEDRTWQRIVDLRQGLVIVTGITGSGKSTTVASLLHHVNRHRRVRMITLEDPVEYLIPSERALVSQREIGTHVESFSEGLRSALREDPDVLFVGEMRDRETTALALSAAETGHLVFSTLHTRDTRGAVSRILDMFQPRHLREIATQLSFSFSTILAQKLVPRADGRGRVVAMEVLHNIPAVGNAVRQGNLQQLYGMLEGNRRAGLSTLEAHLVQLRRAGIVTADVARQYANDPEQLR